MKHATQSEIKCEEKVEKRSELGSEDVKIEGGSEEGSGRLRDRTGENRSSELRPIPFCTLS